MTIAAAASLIGSRFRAAPRLSASPRGFGAPPVEMFSMPQRKCLTSRPLHCRRFHASVFISIFAVNAADYDYFDFELPE